MLCDLFSGFDCWNYNLWGFSIIIGLWVFVVCSVFGSSYWVGGGGGKIIVVVLSRMFWSVSPVCVINSLVVRCGGVFHLLFTLGLFLLGGSVYGVLPYCFAFMAHLPIVLGLSLCFWGSCVVYRASMWGWGVMSASFVPSGVSGALLGLVVLGELVSVCLRPLALCFRLLANLSVGHLFLGVLAQLVVSVVVGSLSLWGLLGSVFLLSLLTAVEFGVAILQSYIFFTLVCFYWLEEDPALWELGVVSPSLKKLVSGASNMG